MFAFENRMKSLLDSAGVFLFNAFVHVRGRFVLYSPFLSANFQFSRFLFLSRAFGSFRFVRVLLLLVIFFLELSSNFRQDFVGKMRFFFNAFSSLSLMLLCAASYQKRC